MGESRRKVVEEAFRKMDKTEDGEITLDDLKNVYNVKNHPRYISGEETEDQILTRFLANFEQDATKDGHVSSNAPSVSPGASAKTPEKPNETC